MAGMRDVTFSINVKVDAAAKRAVSDVRNELKKTGEAAKKSSEDAGRSMEVVLSKASAEFKKTKGLSDELWQSVKKGADLSNRQIKEVVRNVESLSSSLDRARNRSESLGGSLAGDGVAGGDGGSGGGLGTGLAGYFLGRRRRGVGGGAGAGGGSTKPGRKFRGFPGAGAAAAGPSLARLAGRAFAVGGGALTAGLGGAYVGRQMDDFFDEAFFERMADASRSGVSAYLRSQGGFGNDQGVMDLIAGAGLKSGQRGFSNITEYGGRAIGNDLARYFTGDALFGEFFGNLTDAGEWNMGMQGPMAGLRESNRSLQLAQISSQEGGRTHEYVQQIRRQEEERVNLSREQLSLERQKLTLAQQVTKEAERAKEAAQDAFNKAKENLRGEQQTLGSMSQGELADLGGVWRKFRRGGARSLTPEERNTLRGFSGATDAIEGFEVARGRRFTMGRGAAFRGLLGGSRAEMNRTRGELGDASRDLNQANRQLGRVEADVREQLDVVVRLSNDEDAVLRRVVQEVQDQIADRNKSIQEKLNTLFERSDALERRIQQGEN